MNDKTVPLIIKRQYDVAPARLFELLTTPDHLEKWFSPDESIPVRVLAHDFRVGGDYRLRYTMPGDIEIEVHGEFIQIDEPDLITFSWVWQEPDIHSEIHTIVTWRLLEKNEQTELTVIHDQMPSQEFHDRHQNGWTGTLGRLEKLVAKTNDGR